MAQLNSTNLNAATYDDETRTMEISFNSGGTYSYSGVPREIYEGLVASPSPGSYFYRNVKDVYQHRRIN